MSDTRRPGRVVGRPPVTGARPTLRLETWPADPSVGHLVLLEHGAVPSAAELAEVLDRAHRRGHATIRTGALFPHAAAMLAGAGFTTIDSLALLRADLSVEPRSIEHGHRVRTLRTHHHGVASDLDRAAFGPVWGYDARNVAATRRATPAHRARWVGDDQRGGGHGERRSLLRLGRGRAARRRRPPMIGYAIAGAGGSTGYLQRLAVDPRHRRRGVADALVLDALDWMRARGVSWALVNTGVDNEGALRLYARHGFRPLAERLTVCELRLAEVAA